MSISVTDICNDVDVRARVANAVSDYNGLATADDDTGRKKNYTSLVNNYYDLATDFFEYGWSESFHFAPRFRGETFEASLARHEYYLALKLGLKPGMKVADFGCGVGGPMRAIARFSGASLVGVNNNEYQIRRAQQLNQKAGLSHLCDFIKTDYLNIPVPEGTFDAGFALESTCHAPDKKRTYSEFFRTLKPGALFAGYEWCTTENFDENDPKHRAMVRNIEKGNALPYICSTKEAVWAMKEAGFVDVQAYDLAETSDPDLPWYLPLSGPWYTASGFRSTKLGRWVTHQMVRGLEKVNVAPKGATDVSTFLEGGARALVVAGKAGIFTPMYYLFGRKPG